MGRKAREPWYKEGAWLAVKDGDLTRLLAALALESQGEVPWSRWPSVEKAVLDRFNIGNHQEAMAELRRLVFVSPPLEGWRLLVGWRFYASSLEDAEESGMTGDFTEVAALCRRLSRQFGEAHVFTADWENGTFAFILARRGRVVRRFVDASGELVSDEGKPTAAEQALWAAFDPGPDDCPVWFCYEHPEQIAAIAAGCSVHPSRLSECTASGLWSRWRDGIGER
jgi:hypothetical protein